MISDEELLELVLKYTAEHGITGYDIGKHTSISDQSAYRILSGKTKNPRRKNLLEILDYLELVRLNSKSEGVKESPVIKEMPLVKEPAPIYSIETADDRVKQLYRTINEKELIIKSLYDTIESLQQNIEMLKLSNKEGR